VLSAGVLALAGLILWTSFDTAKGVDIRSDDPLPDLSDNVRTRNARNGKPDRQVAAVRSDVDRLTRQGSGLSPAERRRVDRLDRARPAPPP
jgi:hypothetical protein